MLFEGLRLSNHSDNNDNKLVEFVAGKNEKIVAAIVLFFFLTAASIFYFYFSAFFLSLLAAFFLCPFTLRPQVQFVASINSHLGALGKGPLADFLPANKDEMRGGRGYSSWSYSESG